MREIEFYVTASGRCPVMEFIESLPSRSAEKVGWVLDAIRGMQVVPAQYLKKLPGTDGLWEVRAQVGGNAYRLLGFFDGGRLIVLVSGFAKKTEEVPARELDTAQQRRQDYWERSLRNG